MDEAIIGFYCKNCHHHGLRHTLVRHKKEPDLPPRCCPSCDEEVEDLEPDDANKLCRCGHEKMAHKQMFDGGRPTPHFPCAGYGCVGGRFEEIDWDESDANHEEFISYQRNIRQ